VITHPKEDPMPVITPPTLEVRAPRPYAAMRSSVTMSEIPTVLPPTSDDVRAWLRNQGEEPTGPELWRYLVIDMAAKLTVEVGFPVSRVLKADAHFVTGELPGGTYAVTRYHGHPAGLMQATGEFLAWGEANDIQWDHHQEGAADAWRSRIEWYLNAELPDMSTWDTELAFLTR
jgi:effector-binding domain-containing protein